MRGSRRRLGQAGESIAARHLEAAGYRILEHNVRLPGGELDLVALDGDFLVFVEVRTRRGRAYGGPEESVTPAKQRKLLELGQTYLMERAGEGLPEAWRIDVVAVEMDRQGRLLRVDVIRDAVRADFV